MATLKSQYLIFYNGIFAVLWFTLLLRIVALHTLFSYDKTYGIVGDFAKWIQTAALLEVLHSAIGLVRAPLIPTFIQTVAKNLIVWTIVRPFPSITIGPAYAILLITWSISEVIRYGYFTTMLSGLTPRIIIWLRYSAFILIYPIGIGCEMWLVFSALGESDSAWLSGIMCGELALYIPGTYFLYTYMLKQRSKVLKSNKL